MPSTRVVRDRGLETDLPLLSIAADERDLVDPTYGILVNPLETGRNWERPAFASFFEGGRLRFALGAGLRVHGGVSREEPMKSLRLHFREMYGTPSLASDLVFDGLRRSMRSLVVHADSRDNNARGIWKFTNPLAYDLAEEIGSVVPRVKPAQVYLNGRYLGAYVLTEHLSRENLAARFGHDDFVMAKTKPRPDEPVPPEYDELRAWLRATPEASEEEIGARVDLDNLTSWIIAILHGGVTDPFQGPIILDTTLPDGRWYWINWDMDHAFSDRYQTGPRPWEIDVLEGPLGDVGADPRARIFARLMEGSPDYRDRFLVRFVKVMNHLLDDNFVQQRLDHYADLSRRMDIRDTLFLGKMRAFLVNRPPVLRHQLDRHFSVGPSFRLNVWNRRGLRLLVDGHPVSGDYVGHYFASTPARVEVDPRDREGFGGWVVGGEPTETTDAFLELSLAGDLTVEVVGAEP
jgi:hypothetical protein